jgi:hypothetical protein
MNFLQKLMFWRRPDQGETPLSVSQPRPDDPSTRQDGATSEEREYREEQQKYREEEEIQLREAREGEDDPRDYDLP